MFKKPAHAIKVIVTEDRRWDAYGTPHPLTPLAYKLLEKEGINESVKPGIYFYWMTWSIRNPLSVKLHLHNATECL